MRLTWRTSLVIATAAMLLGVVRAPAQEKVRPRDQVAAASRRAIEALRVQIGQEPIGRGATVDDLLKKTMSSKTFMETLMRAQQIGGPRWIDAQTCQVRLEIAGPVVARRLVEIATLDHLESPVPPEVLQYHLRAWDKRTFSATGTSACASAAMEVEPSEGMGWASVSAASRRSAVAAARQDAANQVLQTISSTPLGPAHTVADALKVPAVRQDVQTWLEARPVTQVQFLPDRRVRVTLSTPGDALCDALQASVTKNRALADVESSVWNSAKSEMVSRLGPTGATGTAQAESAGSARRIVQHPQTPPDWVDRQINAVGESHHGSGLKAARAAEADADDKLRGQVQLLPLLPALTIGQAARQDPDIAQAVDRGVGHARTTGTEYLTGGGAKVTATLDLGDVWQELDSSH